jgi:hypothetical protein
MYHDNTGNSAGLRGPAFTGMTAASGIMRAAGDKWMIEACPGGSSMPSYTADDIQRCMEHTSIFITYKGDSEWLRARCTITLVNQLPGWKDRTIAVGQEHVFGQTNTDKIVTHVGCNLVKRSILEDESNGWKFNDRVIVRATITTFSEIEPNIVGSTNFTPPNTIPADLKRSLDSGYNSDIVLSCGDRQFPAHRFVLGSRSPYFKGLFASSMRDADTDGLPIADTEPDVFEQLLLWIYTGEVAEAALQTNDMVEHLLMAANRYECGYLTLLCEAKLCEGLTVANVATRLVLAEQAEADSLKEGCLELIKDHPEAVMATAGWEAVVSAGSELSDETSALLAGYSAAAKQGKKRTADEAGFSAIRVWTTVQLRSELLSRGLDILGTRAELVARLEQARLGHDRDRRT